MEKLSGDYIAGFVDGEGCFALKFRRDVRHERKNAPIYFYWDVEFAIVLRDDDKEILKRIMETLDCGRLIVNNRGMARYAVNDLDDLLYKVAPFFKKYHLHAKKKHDFALWEEALGLLYKNKGLKTNIRTTGDTRGIRKKIWDTKELKRLKEIYVATRPYKSHVADWKWINEA